VDRIPGARLCEVPGGHAPWLADAGLVAGLIEAHAQFAAGRDTGLAGRRRRPGP
jgi:hypothetical protein